MTKLGVARFHAQTGPASLFERVSKVMVGPRVLKLHGTHFNDRAAERDAPRDVIAKFDPEDWELMTVEARVDKGTFVRTTWRRTIDGRTWWVVIGFHDAVQTIYSATPGKSGFGEDIVRDGPVWALVDQVNRGLAESDPSADVTRSP